MTKFAAFVSAIVIASGTAAWAAGRPETSGSTTATASSDAENPSSFAATANTNSRAKLGQRKKTYMTPTANPLRTGDCSAIEMSGQATLNGQPMNGGSSSIAPSAGTGAKAVGQGITKGSGGNAKCWQEGGAENPAPQ
jgi:hypothetical protein